MIPAIPIVSVLILAGFAAYLILTRRRGNWQDDRPADLPAAAAAPAGVPPAYEPHGIDTPQTLAALVAKAEEDARAAQEAAETEPWGEWDEPGTGLGDQPAPPAPPPPPPPSPYPGDVSRAMVHQIDYPDPADLSPDKDRAYRNMLRRVGVATGTHTSLEDTGVWALPALEPGDGTGVPL